jgi:phosphate transport system substrate-binding protein
LCELAEIIDGDTMNGRYIGLALVALATAALGAQAQTLEVSGATTVQKRILDPGAAPLKAATGIELKIYGPGTGRGMIALFEKKVPVAAAGEALEDAVESAKKAATELGKTLEVPSNLVYHEVATDNIVFVVHASNNVPALNKEQVKAIFTGKATNWKEFKGPDLPIKVFAPAPGQAVRSAVEKSILEGAAFATGTIDIRTALEQLKATGASPGAIAPYSEAVIKESTEKLRVVPGTLIRRPLGFVTIGSPTPEAKKMIDYFRSPEGKKTIK